LQHRADDRRFWIKPAPHAGPAAKDQSQESEHEPLELRRTPRRHDDLLTEFRNSQFELRSQRDNTRFLGLQAGLRKMPVVTEPENLHQPVLPGEVLAALDPRPGQIVVDCTVGVGGHARLLAERLRPTGRLLGLDCDAEMLEIARAPLADLPVTLVPAPFDRLADVLSEQGIPAVDAVLADLGTRRSVPRIQLPSRRSIGYEARPPARRAGR
jgi:hypothetical protein